MPEIMSNEVLVGIGGLLLSVLTYFAGVARTKAQLSKRDRDARVQRVLAAYMKLRRTNMTSGLDGLQRSGIATLGSNAEISELFDLVVAHGEPHPLGRQHAVTFAGVALLRLFTYAAQNNVNFLQIPVAQIIKDSGAEA